MNQISYNPSWILLLVLLGGGFLAGIIFRARTARPAAPARNGNGGGLWSILAFPTALFICVVFAYLFFDVATTSRETRVESSHSSISATETISSSSHQKMTVTAEVNNPNSWSMSQGWNTPQFYVGGPKLLILVLLIGGILTWIRPKQRAAVAATPATKVGAAYPWLVVPALCLAGLGTLAAPLLHPPLYSHLDDVPAIFPDIQARMDKAVQELVTSRSQPDSENKNIPSWIVDKTSTPNQQLLSSGRYSSQQEAEDELVPIAADLLQRAFHTQYPWQGDWKVPLAQVRERVMNQRFVEVLNKEIGTYKFYRLHVLVNVSPEICATFVDPWKTQIVERRLKVLGVLLAWLSSVLLLGSVFFRSLTNPGAAAYYWASALKASILTFGLTAAAGWVLVTYIH